jgi:hypothetical protein
MAWAASPIQAIKSWAAIVKEDKRVSLFLSNSDCQANAGIQKFNETPH